MKKLLFIFSFILSSSASAQNWYVDCKAAGANSGRSWTDAFTDFTKVGLNADHVNVYGFVQPGDTVSISGCDYGGGPGQAFNLVPGTSGNWVTYKASQEVGHNGQVIWRGGIMIRNYTTLDGSKQANFESNIVGTYDVPKITDNCNFWLDVSANLQDLAGIGIWSSPVVVKWMHLTGIPDVQNPKSASANLIFDWSDGGSHAELAYLWIDQSSGHGAGAAFGLSPDPRQFGSVNIHHCLIEHSWSDICNSGGGLDFHHNIIRNRAGTGRAGCNDTFTLTGDTSYIRIHHNLIEPGDNTLTYLWGSVSDLHDYYFYDNIITPVRPEYAYQMVLHTGDDPYRHEQGGMIMEQDTYSGANYVMRSNVVYANNTVIGSMYSGVDGFVSLISKDTGPTGFIVNTGAFVFKNNLFVDIDAMARDWTWRPLGLSPGVNASGAGWRFEANAIVLDYNQFWSYHPGNLIIGGWGDSWSSHVTLNNAADVAQYMGYTHNLTDVPVTFADAANWDFHPAVPAVNVGQDLMQTYTLTQMPDLDKDIDGNPRGQNGAWSAGALEYKTLIPTAPKIIQQPQNQSVVIANMARFSITASGYPAPSYQWQKNGQDLSNDSRLTGIHSNTFGITNVGADDEGDYRCVVTNNSGTVTSNSATLTVSSVAGPASAGGATMFLPFKNVFNPAKAESLSVKFTLAESAVTVSIYDRRGDLIKTLWDGGHALGPVTDLTWDGRNEKGAVVASGAYLVHLKTSKVKVTKKVVIIK